MGAIQRLVCILLLTTQCAISIAAADTPAPVSICARCHCIAQEKKVICNNKNLMELFSNVDWTALNATESNSLDTVEFENNAIRTITVFPSLPIRRLNFRHNTIRKIEKGAFANLKLLESLDLSHNELESGEMHPAVFEGLYAPTAYEPIQNLKVLNLSHNSLHTLDPDLFEHFPNLEELDISFNPFKVIDQNSEIAISTIGRLTTLEMSDLELKTLPQNIFHAPRNLKTLDLSGNLFEKIPEALEHAIELVSLNIDDNVFVKIGTNESGGVFPRLPKLTDLSLSFMPDLTHIGAGAFSNLSALQHLQAQSNPKLSYIDKNAFSHSGSANKFHEVWPPITKLILHTNNLSTLSHDMLGRWDEVEEIDLRFNDWQCDCALQWMVEQLIPIIKEKTPKFMEDIKCRHPDEMAGKSFQDIHKEKHQMRCLDYYGRHPERDGPILVGILIGLLIGIPISMAIIVVYKRGCFGMFGYKPRPNDYTRAFYKRAGLHENLDI